MPCSEPRALGWETHHPPASQPGAQEGAVLHFQQWWQRRQWAGKWRSCPHQTGGRVALQYHEKEVRYCYNDVGHSGPMSLLYQTQMLLFSFFFYILQFLFLLCLVDVVVFLRRLLVCLKTHMLCIELTANRKCHASIWSVPLVKKIYGNKSSVLFSSSENFLF